ncbi:type 4a pilus biogenesis protein PilO [Patescibacteria group bacterium]|nr:type 4a pilus biogenesis protein PilO [Patescibacteria group bacterium]
MRYIFSLILLGAAFAMIFFWARFLWQDIQILQQKKAAFVSVITRITELRKARNELLQTYNAISQTDVERIKKSLPDTISAGSLIVEMSNLARVNGLLLKSIDVLPDGEERGVIRGPYESIDLSLRVSGPYRSFRSFLENLEKSLRLVDVTAISFVASESDSYEFSLKAKTYRQK